MTRCLHTRRSATRATPLLALALLLLPCVARAVTVSALPADTTVTIGDEFVVRVVTDGVPDLRAFQFIYQYDPTRLQLLSADPGGLLTGSGFSYSAHLRADYAAPQDSLWYEAALLGGSASGPGVLAYVHFKAIGVGDDPLVCRSVDFRDALNQPTLPACAGTLLHVRPLQRTLTLGTVGSGTVTAVPQQAAYDDGTIVQLTAAPAPCWHFVGWSGNAGGSANPLAVTMDADKSITGTFAIDTHVLTTSPGTGGTIAPSGAVSVNCGSSQTFTVTAGEGYTLADVVVDGGSVGPVGSYTFTNVTTEHTIAATFTVHTYTLTVGTVGSGSVAKAPDLGLYPHFTSVTLTASPVTGWHFVGWSGDTTASANPLVITMKRNRTLTATFAINTYTLATPVTGLGSVTRSPDQALYDHGTVVWLTPVPAPGWFFTGWSGDATGNAVPQSLTMDAPKSVTAAFAFTPPTPAELTLGGHDETTENLATASGWNGSSGSAATPGTVPAGVAGTHLLISEVGWRGLNSASVNDSTEFVEIFNPTMQAIDLARFYLADVNSYAAMPVTGEVDVAASLTDFAFGFPAGAVIGPGEAKVVAVIAGPFKRGSGRDADFALFGAGVGSDAQPMRDVMKNKSVGYPGYGMFSNGGEFVWLYYWDGDCDIVTDVDLVSWGNPTGSNAPARKTTAMCQDGDDAGVATTCYNADVGPVTYLAAPGNGQGTRQRTGSELESVVTGGNGVTVKSTPTVALASSPANPDCETPVTLIATIAPAAPAGVVTFYEGATPLGTSPVSGGVATLSGLVFAAGTRTLTASFGGDCGSVPATSPGYDVTVSHAATSLALAATPNPSACFASITLTATATPATATGTVTFLDGASVIGSADLSGGVATIATSGLALGAHSLTASYAGTVCFVAATSLAIAHDVNPVATAATVTSSNPTSSCGSNVSLTAHVTPTAAPGSVQFMDGATPLGSASVSGGTATIPVSGLTVGTHPITVVFTASDACYAGSTSPALDQVVNPGPVAVALASDVNPTVCQGQVTFTATLAPPVATGTVEFKDGATSLGTVPVSGGTAALPVTALTVGAHSVTATYSGDACYAGGVSPALAHTVNKAPATVALASSLEPSTCGATVTFTATLTPAAASGSVEFFDGVASLGSAAITGGQATFSGSSLGVGTHAVTAVYGGDGCYATATSPALSQTVNRAPVVVGLVTSANPQACGGTLTLTASLSPAVATGDIEFFDGPTSLGVVHSAGVGAALLVSSLGVGSHPLTAAYAGDVCYAPATSPPIAQTITALPTTLALAAGTNPATCATPVTLTATVDPAGAAGTVEFFEGASSLGVATLSAGTATLIVPSLNSGVHTLSAAYAGAGCYAGSTSPSLVLAVNPAAVSLALASDANPTTCGSPVTLTATATPAGASGSVEFRDGAMSLGVRGLIGGVAALIVPSFNVGSHTLTAVYSGDACHSEATTPDLVEVVGQVPVAVSLGSAPLPSVCGQPTLLTATVTPGMVTGLIQFFDGATPLGSSAISAGVATLLVPGFTVGTHPLTATFEGDACLASAASPAHSHVVNRAPVAVTLASDVNPSAWSTLVTLTATLDPAAATGTVEFFDGVASLGTAAATSGVVTLAISTLEVGPHSLNAVYSGDICHAPSASSPLLQSVTPAAAAITLASDLNPSGCGSNVTLTATVTPASATGAVQFLDGATPLGSAPLAAGVASLSVATFAVGGHALTAQYGGDAHFLSATSSALPQVVQRGVSSVSLAGDLNPSVHGQTVVFTATVAPSVATGAVTFMDSLTVLGTSTVSGGVAKFSTAGLSGGAHTQLVAVYSGNACSDSSRSAPWTQLVYRAPTAVTIASDMNPAVVGYPLVLTAHVTPAQDAGTVEYFDGLASLGVAPVVSGVATLVVSPAAPGTLDLTAHYSGDDSFESSVSAPLDIPAIVDAPPAVTVVSPNGSEVLMLGSTVPLTWTATDNNAVQSVTVSVSRDSGSTWQVIAADVPNTGLLNWLVTPPQTNYGPDPRFTALLRVVARDDVGLTATDRSDATFAIYSTSTDVAGIELPREFALGRVWPNPAPGALRIEFAVAAETPVRLSLVDVQGREVALLADGLRAPGRYQVRCDGRTARGPLPAGVYFVRYQARGLVFTRRFVLIR